MLAKKEWRERERDSERNGNEMKWNGWIELNPFSTTLYKEDESRDSSNIQKSAHFSWITTTTAANLTSKWDLIDWFEICCCRRCRRFHCPLPSSRSMHTHIHNLGLAKFYCTSNERGAQNRNSECKIAKQWHKTWLKATTTTTKIMKKDRNNKKRQNRQKQNDDDAPNKPFVVLCCECRAHSTLQ